MPIEFQQAIRKASPMLIAITGVSGSGKTYGSLQLAAGIAGSSGSVGFIDTENGRGSMYADEPSIVKAFPKGYKIAQLGAPYSPDAYVDAIQAAEQSGIKALVIDSVSHEYEGIGGVEEIAEKNKVKGRPNWALAKRMHKRFMNHCLLADMHIIFCVRAREKTRPLVNPSTGKEEYVSLGIQPIAEKNFMFEMTASLLVDEQTHFANPIKVPKMLTHLFPGGRMLTKEDGERIREWNETGAVLDPTERLVQRARAAAEDGVAHYREFFTALTAIQKRALASVHEENKRIAEQADAIPVFGSAENPVQWPDAFDGPECIWNGKHLRLNELTGNYAEVSVSNAA